MDDENKTPNEVKDTPTEEKTKESKEDTSQSKADHKQEKPSTPQETRKESHKKDEHREEEPAFKEGKPGKGKQPKKETKEPPKKIEDFGPDFQYIVRIANTDLDGKRRVVNALTQIKGLGWHMAYLIADTAGVNKEERVGKLKEPDIEKLKQILENITSLAPPWMLNHRFDYDTGNHLHLISTDVAVKLRDDINLMKMIRCYKGVRHEMGLPVRGQRTKANGRIGLAMGVQRKTVQQTQQAKTEG